MKAKSLMTVFSLFIVFALAFAVVSPALAGAPAPSRRQAVFEVKFMKEMIDHHHMAVMMAEMCLDKAVHEDLRSMCEQIIADQTGEIQMMQSWLQDWYGVSYEPQMKPKDMRMMEMLAEMEGEAFEIEFMQEMIMHHSMAVKMAEKCVQRADHPELLETCNNIITIQMEEIRTLQTWLCEWYGICEDHHM